MKKAAFTLVEVMVVMAIMAILSVLIIGSITIARKTSKETVHRGNAKIIQAGMERYYSIYKHYPFDAGAEVGFASFTCTCTLDALGVNLQDTSECDGNTISGHLAEGGGYIEYLPSGGNGTTVRTGYIIHVGDYSCSGELETIRSY
jgi:prepilin-type N-terminal cleavage/methylation domain-containing protein